MPTTVYGLCLTILLCFMTPTFAQGIQGEGPGSTSLETIPRLDDAFAPPLNAPVTVVRQYFTDHMQRLGSLPSYASSLALYKAWNAALPQEQLPKDKLLNLLADGAQHDASIIFNQPHFDAPDERFSGRLMIGLDLYFAGRDEEVLAHAEKIIVDTRKERRSKYSRYARGLSPFDGWSPFRGSSAVLGLAGALELKARVLMRKGSFRQALAAAEDGIDAAEEALDIVKVMPPNEVAAAAEFQSKETLATLQLLKMRAQVATGSILQGTRTLETYLSLSREVEAHPRFFWNLGVSQYNQRNFVQAEQNFRRADAAAERSGYRSLSFFRSDCGQGIIGALVGQKKWAAVNRELARYDALAGEDETLKYRIRYQFERGYAYLLTSERLEESETLFQELLAYSTDGLLSAHAKGLRGVALWRLRRDSAMALALLKEAVDVYMKPIYFSDQALGLNADVRDLVIGTYVEAIFQTAGEDPMQALGPAEWVGSSSVQSALADAAIRSATKDPAISELVRKDQDLKNEIRNLRTKAAVELDSEVTSKVNALNLIRAEVQVKIKAIFPEYEMLVSPSPPNLATATKELAVDEVFVLLLPTDKSVFVWTLSADGKNVSAQITLPKAELQKMVKDLRVTLDFAEMGRNLTPFNKMASAELYRRLLLPVEASLKGKKHIIVAAGGVLGQIPFGVLLSEPSKNVNDSSPFLIKQFAISHVPSLSAWLSVRMLAQNKRAPETLIAWGDPTFGGLNRYEVAAGKSVRSLELTRSQQQMPAGGPIERESLRYSDIPRLPETRDELMAIAGILQANPSADLHLGDKATKTSVLNSSASGELARKKVVVFATHGLMAGDLPNLQQPALALANVDDTDQDSLSNLLLLEDVLGLKLNSDWVVLSACNTAAADGKVEEAMSGLARGFFYAGSRSLLVTHWAVETESAKLLTTNTFQHYTENPGARKAESLRQAMLSVMAKPAYQHPAYWAPYALVGDGAR
ncbi:CHAT domain-containing protein [Rhodoferax aquaticus]|uniref:CHAT domain-containing protein n=1 Tax=Rhodoferax aquaticus TaxID=2527691 RepID=A0A515ERC2_9BURK|nr:CHAT domain-containing protein [Rhodoferax aquaticus]QDL55207.1 CHAT domain-containing protein [Rhodoferax aquaticus]